MPPRKTISWNKINSLVKLLHKKTAHLDKDKQIGIIGVSRGGLIPAVMLSHIKKTSFFSTIGLKSYENMTKKAETIYQLPEIDKLNTLDILYVVDDICDTGKTFKFLLDKVFTFNNIKTLSLFYKKNNIYKPDFFGMEVDRNFWVDFPFELH